MTRVLVVDDHAIVRQGLVDLLSAAPDLELVGAAPDGETAVRMVEDSSPDVVLMDLSMPRIDGLEATRRVLAARPECHVVVLTAYSEHDRILAAVDAGAVGYLLKDSEPEELLRGVRAAAAGEAPFSPRAAHALLRSRASSPADRLTSRERDVLRLVGHGLTNKVIAKRLGISEKTVKAHLTSAFARAGVHGRTEAALWARDHGLR